MKSGAKISHLSGGVKRSAKWLQAVVWAGLTCLGFWADAPFISAAQGQSLDLAQRQGAENTRDRQIREALRQTYQTLEHDPRNRALHLLAGELLLHLEDPVAAEKEIKFTQRTGSRDTLANFLLGQAYLAQRKYHELLEQIFPGQPNTRQSAPILLLRGQAHLGLAQYQQARTAFEGARAMLPRNAAPVISLGQLELALGEFRQGLDLAETAIQLEPESASAWLLMIHARRFTGDLYGALEASTRHIGLVRNDVTGHIAGRLARASLALEMGMLDIAAADLAKTRQLDPENIHGLFLATLLEASRGNQTEAKDFLGHAARLRLRINLGRLQNDPRLAFMVGAIAYKSGDYELAEIYFGRYVRLSPNDPGGRLFHAAANIFNGNVNLAVLALTQGLAISPDDIGLLALMGTANLIIGDYLAAAHYLERATAITPTAGEVRRQFALALVGTGQLTAAIEVLKTRAGTTRIGDDSAQLMAVLEIQNGAPTNAVVRLDNLISAGNQNPRNADLVGIADLALGNPTAARQTFTNSLKHAPDDLFASVNLAQLELDYGDVAVARNIAERLLERDQTFIPAMWIMADTAARHGAYQTQQTWLRRVQALAPDDETLPPALVKSYLAEGDYGSALAVLDQYLGTHLNHHQSLIAKAAILTTQGQHLEAISVMQPIVEWVENRPTALYQLALAQSRAGQAESAILTLRRVLAWEPSDRAARLALVELEARGGDIREALFQAAEFSPEAPTGTHAVNGAVLMEGKDFSGAEAAYLASFNEQVTLTALSGMIYARLAQGQPGRALSLLEGIPEHQFEKAVLGKLYVAVLTALGRYGDAAAWQEIAVEQSPGAASGWNNLAWIYLHANNDQALASARRAHEIAPESASVLDTLGWVLMQAGEPAQAIQYLRRAQENAPLIGVVGYHLAVVLAELGQAEAARDELLAALGPEADFEGIIEARALLEDLTGS